MNRTTKYQIPWARRALEALKEALGGKCSVPGCSTGADLEFDCIIPQGHKHHSAGVKRLACFYRKQAAVGNLQLLCRVHHEQKSVKDAKQLNENDYER